MAAGAVTELPAGFTVDQPAAAAGGADLPAGFTPDAPAAAAPPQLSGWDRIMGRGPKRAGGFTGDAGSLASAGQAYGAVGDAITREAYREGGNVTDAAINSGMVSPELAAKLGFATNVAVESVPTILGTMAGGVLGSKAGEAAQAGAKGGARQLMQSAMKPNLAARESGKAGQAVDTMLETGTNVTPGGVQKLNDEIDRLNVAIKAALANSRATVDKAKIAQTLDQLTQQFKMQVTPQSDMAAVRQALDDFLNHPLLAQISDIPVQLAQELKQGTYRALGNKSYGELKGASTEAQKALARGLKEEIATAVPGIGDLNAAESKLINARDIAESRVLADANKNPLGLGILNPKMLAIWLADRSPLAKSLLARGIYSGADVLPATGRTLGAVGGAYATRPNPNAAQEALANPAVTQQLGLPPVALPQPLPGRDRGPGMTGVRG